MGGGASSENKKDDPMQTWAKENSKGPDTPTASGAGPETAVDTPPKHEGPGAAPALKPSGGGGLAARRAKMGLQVATHKKAEDRMQAGEALPGSQNVITKCERFSDFYTIGSEVMPSTNTGMDVKFAQRHSDGNQVVVKIREKQTSFCDKNEEAEWRGSTQMLMNLQHSDSIAKVYEVKEDSHAYYVVMEKCEGMDLFEFLHGAKPPLATSKAILRRLLEAVQALHAKGCIHKDLKLENVMVATPMRPQATAFDVRNDGEEPPEPVVKLIDFDTVEEFSPKLAPKAKSVVGTDQYIAQEAYAGKYSPASDIFAVGVIAYKLFCGKFPFKESMFDDKPGENWVGSPKMKVIQDRLKKFHIDWNRAPWKTETKARDLTRWMLEVNEQDRPSAMQCLQHAFFERTGTTPGLPLKQHLQWG